METIEQVKVATVMPGKDEDEKKDELVSCEWKDCKKTHAKKPSYPKNGVLSRSSGFADAWVSAGLEPWDKYGDGVDSFAGLSDYREETPKAAYARTAAAMKHPKYHTQKHHLISINLFKNVPKLKHDAKLVGYDVNAASNGVCLPTYVADIVRHDLQAHRGSHPNNLYNSKIQPLLKKAEEDCLKFCKVDREGNGENQRRLLDKLERISRTTESRIKQWKWLLRSDALAERERSRARLASLQAEV
jgi:hypothetical protein